MVLPQEYSEMKKDLLTRLYAGNADPMIYSLTSKILWCMMNLEHKKKRNEI